MADIQYTIEYEKKTGLKTSANILAIGTADRIQFVTTAETLEYLEKEGQKAALLPNPKKPSPFKVTPKIYILPVTGAKWNTVVKRGKKGAFHFDCGFVDSDGVFHKWEPPAGAPKGQVYSLPFP